MGDPTSSTDLTKATNVKATALTCLDGYAT
jgi:hypothetical protein